MSQADVEGTFVRVCPSCGAEFVATVETCYDCGTALETRVEQTMDDGSSPLPDDRSAASASAPPAGWLAIEIADLDWALELRDRLAANGIGCRFDDDCASCRPTLRIFVAPENQAAAGTVARALYLEKVPDAAEAAPLGELADDLCPACGAHAQPEAPACPDCGLAFLPPATTD